MSGTSATDLNEFRRTKSGYPAEPRLEDILKGIYANLERLDVQSKEQADLLKRIIESSKSESENTLMEDGPVLTKDDIKSLPHWTHMGAGVAFLLAAYAGGFIYFIDVNRDQDKAIADLQSDVREINVKVDHVQSDVSEIKLDIKELGVSLKEGSEKSDQQYKELLKAIHEKK